MIVDGLKLTLLGMSVVFLFLALLIAAIRVSAHLLKPLSEREAMGAAGGRSGRGAAPPRDRGSRTMAVLAAAVAAHRSRSSNR